MKIMQDSAWERALVLCEAVLSGEASKQVLDAAKAALSALPFHARREVVHYAVNRGSPRINLKTLVSENRPPIRCALANI